MGKVVCNVVGKEVEIKVGLHVIWFLDSLGKTFAEDVIRTESVEGREDGTEDLSADFVSTSFFAVFCNFDQPSDNSL